MARTASDTPKGKHVGASVSAELAEWFDARQWQARTKVPDLVREALTEYATKYGFGKNENSEPAPKK